jgi:ribosomal protein S5
VYVCVLVLVYADVLVYSDSLVVVRVMVSDAADVETTRELVGVVGADVGRVGVGEAKAEQRPSEAQYAMSVQHSYWQQVNSLKQDPSWQQISVAG